MSERQISVDDVREQAEFELFIERFEQAVKVEKERLRNKKSWFPWRIQLINVNEVKNVSNKYRR